MFATYTIALMLTASAVVAQVSAPSVVTFISISPVPTTEGVFTIQTSVPAFPTTACFEVCIMQPCPPCSRQVTSEGSMGIPPGETPIASSLISDRPSNPITTPAGSTAAGNLSSVRTSAGSSPASSPAGSAGSSSAGRVSTTGGSLSTSRSASASSSSPLDNQLVHPHPYKATNHISNLHWLCLD
ncbi:hypothetical protein GQ44DRAFT_394918 [Phaeosphaeriaceae sp. PMI808]|nr:hypothetical protein GQ44DRAFT_394918 [Phaeosphaeriaceae sp. PMI808]